MSPCASGPDDARSPCPLLPCGAQRLPAFGRSPGKTCEAGCFVDQMSGQSTPSSTGAGRQVVYLHIGAPKSGTTYLQNILWRNRDALRRDGVLYPGDTHPAHVYAAFDLRNAGFHGYRDPNVPGAWTRMLDEVRAWPGTVIISQELFSPATPEQVGRAMAALSFAEVHLIYTARDLPRQIPAAWQEDVKNRHTLSFDDFVRSLREPSESRHPLGTAFWRMQDAVEVLERWSRDIPPPRVHVVTVPPPRAPKGLLWERFARVVGLDSGRYDAASRGSNLSLGATEADLLRRVNLKLGEGVPWPAYEKFVKHYLAQEVLARRPDPLKIAVPGDCHAWVAARSEEIVAGLRDTGYDVVGDLNDLLPPERPPVTRPTASSRPDGIADTDLVEAATDAVAALVERLGEVHQPEHRAATLERELAKRRRAPVKQMLIDLSERHPALMRARVAYWWIVNAARRLSVRSRRT